MSEKLIGLLESSLLCTKFIHFFHYIQRIFSEYSLNSVDGANEMGIMIDRIIISRRQFNDF